MKMLNFVTVSLFVFFQIAVGQHLLNFQGLLSKPSGEPVNDSTYSVTFKMFTSESEITPFWNESQQVSTNRGMFNVLLGRVSSINTLPASNAYLEIYLDSDLIIERQRIQSVAYAVRSNISDNSEKLGGKNPEEYYGRTYHNICYVKPNCSTQIYVHPRRENPQIEMYLYLRPLDAPVAEHYHGAHSHSAWANVDNTTNNTFDLTNSGREETWPGDASPRDGDPFSINQTSIGNPNSPLTVSQSSIPIVSEIWIDGINVTNSLNGPWGDGTSTDTGKLDLSQWITDTEEHVIEIKTGNSGGRLIYNIYVE